MPRLWKLMPAVALSAALLVLVSGVLMVVFNERAYRAQKIDQVSSEARILSDLVTAALVFDDTKAAQEYVDALEANPEVRAAAIYDANGRYFSGYARQGAAAAPGVIKAGEPVFTGANLIVTEPVRQGRSTIGTVYIETIVEPLSRRIEGYAVTILMLVMAALVVGILAAAQRMLGRANRELGEANQSLRAQIEQREVAEAALRQSQKMEAIGQLTGGVAHDFNNILQVILGNLDAVCRRIEMRLEPALAVELRHPVDGAIRGAERAANLTQRLLAFARKQPLDPKALDPNKLVTGMSDLLRRTLGEMVTNETVLAGGVWKISVDANQLENALLNLAINARDAMPDGGKLTIETANTYLDEAYAAEQEIKSGQYVMIAVTDTGVGMTKDTIAKAFDPFFTTKEVGLGTGLGLSQVYGFVKQSGGHVRIYSEPGQGTTVKIYLPRIMDAQLASDVVPEESAALPAARSGDLVLVVEDDEEVRASTTEIVRHLGYAILEAGSGPAALRILDGEPGIRLLFTDVGLPGGMNGRQLADEARRRRPELKVLYATGYARNAIVHQGRLDPGVDLITKPFTAAALANKMREVLER